METLLRISINLFSAIILIIILINENRRKGRFLKQERLFLRLVYPNIVLCISDAVAWSRENTSGLPNIIINHIFSSAAFLCIPILTYCWFLYALYNIFRNDRLLERFEKAFLPLIGIFAAVVLLNPATNWLFYLDSKNCYHRGVLFYPFTIVPYIILFITFVMILCCRRLIQPGHFLPMLFFVIPALATSLLAILVYGIAIAWAGTTIAIFIIYLFIQNQRLGIDYLTGLHNRRQLSEYLHSRMRGRRVNDCFGIAMIDIDQFKYINDTWGHMAGDEVLLALSEILKATFRKREFLARYAGDEFIIVFEATRKEQVASALRRFIKAIDRFNSSGKRPWKLSVSIGYELYEPSSGMTAESLLHHVDKLMYQAKQCPKASP